VQHLIKWPAKKFFSASEKLQKNRLKRSLSIPPIDQSAITAIAVVRDEALRLPFFLSYYEKMGIERFIILDHGSTDDTAGIVDEHRKSIRVPVSGNFIYKTAWISALLEACCTDRWCLVLDADEFLIYPRMRDVPLAGLVRYLEENGYDALQCQLLDMFPESNVGDADYRRGQNPLEVAPYFDRNLSTRVEAFGVAPDLRKTPLNMLLRLVDRHYGRELEAYQARIDQDPALVLYSPDSVKYESPDQLVELDLMSSSSSFEGFASAFAAHRHAGEASSDPI
jgi:glycosyltransferase involved in cell wall biosynthesis